MNTFLLIAFGVPILDLLFGWWADTKLRRHVWLRVASALFVATQLLLYAGFVMSRVGHFPLPLPAFVAASMYIWSLVILPLAMIVILIGEVLFLAIRMIRNAAGGKREDRTDLRAEPSQVSRRQFMVTTAAVLPPLVALGGVGYGVSQLKDIRVRRFAIRVPQLPANLDGITIVHVSDLHIGKFVDGAIIGKVTEITNLLKPDLICFTGDLIDFSLSDLPAGVDMLKKLDARYGVYVCEGNHDLFASPAEFVRRTKAAGIELLSDESRIVRARGEEIQLLGMRWGMSHNARAADIPGHADVTLRQLRGGAFPILLAHHPHAFDPAVMYDVPLTLAGHTHGGQLMLTPNFGPGPMMYKYWSGLYQQRDCSLIVSNGVGNWFPLRINAPAEVVHVTLLSANR